MSLSGWGRCPVHRCLTYRPERWREVREIVTSTDLRSIIVRGAGRSYGDAALNHHEGVLLSQKVHVCEHYLVLFDPDIVRAGMPFGFGIGDEFAGLVSWHERMPE